MHCTPLLLPRSIRLLLHMLLWSVSSSVANATPTAEIYQQKCAACHGTAGQGVADRYEGPLYGDESIAELTKRIAETMPEDDPDACVGAEATAVAKFIHNEFYSYEARLTKGLISPPRVELSRLTVPQYRNVVADLLAGFTPPARDGRPKEFANRDDGGLLGKYYQSKKMNKRDAHKLTRIDQRIDFDFADQGPTDDIDPEAFAIIWTGSFSTHHTGYHEFRTTSPNGVRLYINTDESRPRGKLRDDDSAKIRERLIDGWVSSREMRTLTGRIFLLAERQYPLRLEFFKYQEPSASMRLEWKPPHGVLSSIDGEMLSPKPVARSFVVDTPFPADDRSVGYERGSAVSREWHSAVTNAALATADEVLRRLPQLSKIKYNAPDRSTKLAEFILEFAKRAYRRPLTTSEEKVLRDIVGIDNTSDKSVRQALLLVLTSPSFLYVNLPAAEDAPTAQTVAARLALTLWDSLPDKPLRQSAERDKLQNTAQIEKQATRMLDHPRTREKLRGFFQHWLELEERDLSKDRQLYPEFDAATIADLRRSLELFLDRVVWSDESDYRELLQADYLLLNQRLRKLYGPTQQLIATNSNSDDGFQKISPPSENRSGILTHPYLLSAFAYHNNTSPIHRGVFLTRNIVGRQLKTPPIAVAFEDNQFAPDLTMREKVTELTRDQACLSCHEVINPLGFALENFDAVGRWRTKENEKDIDPRSDYTSAAGEKLTFNGPRDIANFAIASPIAQRAFIKQLFQHFVKQSPAAYGAQMMDELHKSFVADNFHIRRLLVQIATRTAAHNHPH